MPGHSAITPDQFTSFGELLKYLRRRAVLTQRELAIAVGYSESQISRLEQNARVPDEAAVAARFMPALDIEHDPEWAARLIELARAAPHITSTLPSLEHERAPGNLPIQLTSFVGRAGELAQITALLSPFPATMNVVRMLTLTGTGGAGKTRLALEAAEMLSRSFPDGVWFVELAALTEPSRVPHAVARVLDIHAEGRRSLLATLTGHLREKRLLIVLDNCEHLLDGCAQLVEALLQACPDLRILATSREILDVPGEYVLRVSSLPTPDPRAVPSLDAVMTYDAIRLFVERATTVDREFTLNGNNAPAVISICHRLDGIPLAIELAASRLRMLSAEQLAARLDDCFGVLTDGSRTALPRHQTLRGLMDWSYDLLTPEEQTLLRRLAVFVGGWALEAAEAITAGDDIAAADVFGLLAHLVDKSLVVAETHAGPARYRMLEPIRQYALAKFDASGEEIAVRRRHAEHYLALVAAAGDLKDFEAQGPQLDWIAHIDADADNVRSAVAWVQAAPEGRDLEMRFIIPILMNLTPEKVDNPALFVETALVHARESKALPQAAYILYSTGNYLEYLGEFEAAHARYAEALAMYREMGDLRQVAETLERLGCLAREQGDAAAARLLLDESTALFRQLGDTQAEWAMCLTLGEVAVLQEDAAWARALLEEALVEFRSRSNIQMTGWALNHLGHTAQLEGDFERATQLHEESLALFRIIGTEVPNLAWDLQSLGECALGLGNSRLASTRLAEALGMFHGYGYRPGVAWCLAGLAGVAALERQPQRAAQLWGASESLRTSIGARPAPAARATRERLLAAVREQLGEMEFAAEWARGQALTVEEAIAHALELTIEEREPTLTPGGDSDA